MKKLKFVFNLQEIVNFLLTSQLWKIFTRAIKTPFPHNDIAEANEHSRPALQFAISTKVEAQSNICIPLYLNLKLRCFIPLCFPVAAMPPVGSLVHLSVASFAIVGWSCHPTPRSQDLPMDTFSTFW